MVKVRRLPVERWKDFRDLRLEALKSDPTAFGSSYEEEERLEEVEWKRRIQNALFALSDGKLVGMIAYAFNDRPKTKHIASIYGVYVRSNQRSAGIGRKLLQSALSLIQANKEIVKVKLTVNPEQQAAVRLYKGMGFVVAGRMKKDLKVGREFFDELSMEKLL